MLVGPVVYHLVEDDAPFGIEHTTELGTALVTDHVARPFSPHLPRYMAVIVHLTTTGVQYTYKSMKTLQGQPEARSAYNHWPII